MSLCCLACLKKESGKREREEIYVGKQNVSRARTRAAAAKNKTNYICTTSKPNEMAIKERKRRRAVST